MRKKTTRTGSNAKRRGSSAKAKLVRTTSAEIARLTDTSDWERALTLTDEEIHAAIADDQDAAPLLGDAFWRNAEILDPGHEKRTVTMRVDDDVLDFFRRGGSGYQSRMNAVLRAYVYSRKERTR